MRVSLDEFLHIAEHFYRVYIKFYDLAQIEVEEKRHYKEIDDIITQMLYFTYECNEDLQECNLENFGMHSVVEPIKKGKEYAFLGKRLGLYFTA